jgi:hypothetical protein
MARKTKKKKSRCGLVQETKELWVLSVSARNKSVKIKNKKINIH